LHGPKGGPLCCLLCVGKWDAEHAPRRRARRVLIKALKAYEAAGGSVWGDDFDKLKVTTSGVFRDDTASVDFRDLTTELLTATLALTHPDKHPPERKAEANRVTQELVALRPFVFPAPQPEPPPKPKSRSKRSDVDHDLSERLRKLSPLREYPCEDCRDTIPDYYCAACKAEYDKREREDFEWRTTKQRAEYARRRSNLLARRPPTICSVCLKEFRTKRSDARFCSDRCRQHAHRKAPVTDKTMLPPEHSFNRDRWKRRILALLGRHHAVYLNDLLPESRTRAQYQQLCRVAAELEDAGQIETVSYMCRWGYPGHKVLVKPGHTINDRKVVELKNTERLATTGEQRACEGNDLTI
jgi:hypothetical protein